MMNENYGDQLMHLMLLQKLRGNGHPMEMINGNSNQMMRLMLLNQLSSWF